MMAIADAVAGPWTGHCRRSGRSRVKRNRSSPIRRRARRLPLRSPAVEGTHLSSQAHQRLQDELAERTGEHRQEIAQWIERAREHGDIRENADYDAAKNEQGHNEARIRQLEAILRDGRDRRGRRGRRRRAGVVVEIRMDGDDETTSTSSARSRSATTTYEVLSVSSPLGPGAARQRSRAPVVTYEGPRRTMSVEVVGIRARWRTVVRPDESSDGASDRARSS